MMKTYRVMEASGDRTVRARSSPDALIQAIRSMRRGRSWRPDDGSEHSVSQLVCVVCVDDENDEACDYAQMWP